jgi:cytochrome c553
MRHLSMAVMVFLLLGGMGGAAFGGPLDTPGATKAITCSACHGPQVLPGVSPSTAIPSLAGMWPVYFKKAITDFAEGKRPSAEMEPYAKMVMQMGVDDLAAYFSAQPRQATAITLDPAAVARGQAAAGPCIACHRGGGTTVGPAVIPDLRGQPRDYLRNQMVLFKQNKRNPGDANLTSMKAMMNGIPDGTLADLAAYFSSLK